MNRRNTKNLSRMDFLKLMGLFSLGFLGLSGCEKEPSGPKKEKSKDDSSAENFRPRQGK